MSKEIQKELEITKDIQYFMSRRSLNIDISFRCPLECPRCQRQRAWRNNDLKVPGRDLTLEEIDKISDFYNDFHFCGQLSDPVHHPKFLQILEMLHKKNVRCEIHNAASQKSKEYYIKKFVIKVHINSSSVIILFEIIFRKFGMNFAIKFTIYLFKFLNWKKISLWI